MVDLDERIREWLAAYEPTPNGLERTLERRRRRDRKRRVLSAGLALLIAAGGVTGAFVAFRPGNEVAGDRGSLESPTCLSADEPGLITCEKALQRAGEEYGRQGHEVHAELSWYSPQPGSKRLRVWIVTYEDVPILRTGISGPGGPPGCMIHDWEVVIDARTGDFLVAGSAGNSRPCPSRGETLQSEVCDFPRYRPTYLPWLEPGEPVPEPGQSLTSDGGGPQGLDPAYATLVWGFGDISTPGGPPLEGTLTLWRSTQSVGAFPIDPAVPRLPDGSTGRFYEGEGDDWSIVWGDTSGSPYDDPCSETVLGLTMTNLTSSEQREELIKVARSLTSSSP